MFEKLRIHHNDQLWGPDATWYEKHNALVEIMELVVSRLNTKGQYDLGKKAEAIVDRYRTQELI